MPPDSLVLVHAGRHSWTGFTTDVCILLRHMQASPSKQEQGVGTCNLYFKAPNPPSNEPILYLNGTDDGIVNNCCFPSTVAPSYAPPGQVHACAVGSSMLVVVCEWHQSLCFVVPQNHCTYRLPDNAGKTLTDVPPIRFIYCTSLTSSYCASLASLPDEACFIMFMQALVSVSTIGTYDGLSDQQLISTVTKELSQWFGASEVASWTHLQTYRIPFAQPNQTPPTNLSRPVVLGGSLFVCGDHRYAATFDAALVSGRHAAEAVLAQAATQITAVPSVTAVV